MGYPITMKEAVIKKVLMSGRPHHEIAKEAGIGRSTLTYWLKNYKKDGNTTLAKKEKRPQDWTAEERLNALMETGTLSEKERVAWCRSNGLFIHHLDQWKKDVVSLLSAKGKQGNSHKTSVLKKEISVLKKDLHRKEKALAETAALLVLKKKADSIWGETKDD